MEPKANSTRDSSRASQEMNKLCKVVMSLLREYRMGFHVVGAPSLTHCCMFAFPFYMPVVKVNNDIFLLFFKGSP